MKIKMIGHRLVELKDWEVTMTHVGVEEFRTIYFALKEYNDNLEATLAQTKPEDFEDRMFLHETLHRNYKMLFDMLEDHDQLTKDTILNWADCI